MAFNTGNSDSDGDNVLAEINMIPFIDVMLVLLIISMVTTPFLEQGVNVELPVAGGQNLQKTQSNDAPVTLIVGKDRNLRIGDTIVLQRDLARKLGEVFKDRSQRELFVRADKAVPYGVVAEVMAVVQSAGIERVGLVTQPE